MLADERSKDGHVKKRFTTAMQDYVEEKLKRYQWSPEQIVGRAKLEGVEMVSHERIYQFIWQDKANGGELYKHLRTGQKKYKKRYGSKSSRGQIPDKISIEQRPDIVDKKERAGDFESDLIIGKNHKGAVLTIVDRYSSFLLMADVGGKEKQAIKKATINLLASYKAHTHTITNDNGKEFAAHKAIAEKLECKVYFAHPLCLLGKRFERIHKQTYKAIFPKKSEP